MPPLAVGFTNPTGKRAMLASFKAWLEVNVPSGTGWTYSFLDELNPTVMPRVEVSEFNYFSPGDTAMGGVIFTGADSALVQKEGRRNMAMLEINIYTDQSKDPAAYQALLKIRDAVVYGLVNSGTTRDSDDTEILPPVIVKDPANSNASTETIARVKTEEDNAVVENYYRPSSAQPQIHRQQILARVEWWEMRN